MNKYLKPVFLILYNILLTQGISSQIQNSVTDMITKKFIEFCKAYPREDIYIHSDREEYIAGEILWFSVYLTDRQSDKLSMTGIVYCELLNQANRPIVQRRIKIENGSGAGQLELPDTLGTGTYTLRAYTTWMKNFLPEICFMKSINIYNTLSNKDFAGKKYVNDNMNPTEDISVIQKQDDRRILLEVNNLKSDTLELFLKTNDVIKKDNSEIFYIFIQTHGIINYVGTEWIHGSNTKITLSKKILLPGINQITLFDSKGEPLKERLIYTPHSKTKVIDLISSDSCKRREKISLGIEFTAENLNASDKSIMSISVVPATASHIFPDIDDYLVFGSEYGVDPLSLFKGRKLNDIAAESIDSLLLTLKSNWMDWKEILSGVLPVTKYGHENETHFLNGRLIPLDNRCQDSGRFIIMATPGKTALFLYSKTDKDGNFKFSVPSDQTIREFIIQPDYADNSRIKIESPFSESYIRSETISSNNPAPEYISTWSANWQVNRIYGSSPLGEQVIRNEKADNLKRFYGKPDLELAMEDYVKLPVMEEVFFELIPGVFLKNRKSGYEITMMDPLSNKIFESPPRLLIDGVVINDPAIIANMDMEVVEKIDVIKDIYWVGDYRFFGIVNVITKAGDFRAVTLPGYATRIMYKAADSPRSFVFPDYSSVKLRNSRIPDLRNTLYWNQVIKPVENGKARIEFWTSDYLSDYLITIQGITSDGEPISCKKLIRVK